MNPLLLLKEYGQTVWLDYIQRGLITTGELRRFVEEDGLGGSYLQSDNLRESNHGGL